MSNRFSSITKITPKESSNNAILSGMLCLMFGGSLITERKETYTHDENICRNIGYGLTGITAIPTLIYLVKFLKR